jgi:hypothetical protein
LCTHHDFTTIQGTKNIYIMVCGVSNKIIVCPGLGTEVGMMDYEESANNILQAHKRRRYFDQAMNDTLR